MKGWARPEDGTVPLLTRRAPLVQSFSGDPTVEDFGCEPAWQPVPSQPPGTPPRRTRARAESWLVEPLVGRPTGWAEPDGRPEPEAPREWAPDALTAGSPCSGWERPSSLAVDLKREPVRWGPAESPAPALA